MVVSALAAGCSGSAHAKKPLITTERVKSAGFYGIWERPRGAHHHTAIVLLGGSDGGLVHTDLVAALAEHGYPVLDLAYFREPGLPQTLQRIRLEYFQHALRWLAKQPQVDSKRIVTFGISRGGELSLILASMFPTLVHGVVGYVPDWFVAGGVPDPSQPAWTYRGKPLFGWPVTGIIPVWKINGPVFVVGGGDDTLGQSALSVRSIVREMHQHGRRDVTGLIYPNAGHLVGLVSPVAYHYPFATGTYGVIKWWAGINLNLGGSAKADLAARKDSWPKLLKFLAGVTR